jgi:alkyl sulfatase BDS1-like metallo-beta-lactamase superfamily hydrolase
VLDGERTGLHLRNHIAAPTDGTDAVATLATSRATWAEILTGRTTLGDALTAGAVTIAGDAETVQRALGAIDLPGFA